MDLSSRRHGPPASGPGSRTPPPGSARHHRHQWRWEPIVLAAIILAGALLRWSYLAEILRAPGFSFPMVDPLFSDYWARGLVTGNWSSSLIEQTYGWLPEIASHPYLRPPGYPYFLAFVYFLFGFSYLAIRIVQMALGLVSAVLGFFLGRSIFGSATGLTFAAFMSAYWGFIYFEGDLEEPALVILLVLSLMLLLLRLVGRLTFWRALAAGLALGLSALVRGNMVAFAPFALAWCFWLARRRGEIHRFAVVALGLVVGAVIAIAPATIRNYAASGEFVPISANLGVNLTIGNNSEAQGTFIGEAATLARFGSCFDYPRIVSELEKETGRRLNYSQVSSYYTSRAVSFIRENPRSFWRLLFRKAYLFFGPREITLDKVVEVDRANSPTLSRIPGNFPAALALALTGAGLLAVDLRRPSAGRRPTARGAGRAPCLRAQHGREGAVLAALFVPAYAASYLPFFVTAGYRVPIIPFLLLFGAYGVCRLGGFLRARAFRRAGLWVVAAALLYALARFPFVSYQPELDKWHFDRGVAYAFDGQRDAAIREYRQAIATASRPSAPPYSNLAVALAASGRMDEAAAAFTKAIEIDPGLGMALCGLADVRASQGQAEEAVRWYREAIENSPGFTKAYCNLGVLLLQEGRPEEAARLFERALELGPGDLQSMNNLAWLFATSADESLRDGPRAVTLAERAAELAGQANAGFLDTLAAAYAEAGRFGEAVATAERALGLAGHETALAETLQGRIESYRAGRPYRERLSPSSSSRGN